MLHYLYSLGCKIHVLNHDPCSHVEESLDLDELAFCMISDHDLDNLVFHPLLLKSHQIPRVEQCHLGIFPTL